MIGSGPLWDPDDWSFVRLPAAGVHRQVPDKRRLSRRGGVAQCQREVLTVVATPDRSGVVDDGFVSQSPTRTSRLRPSASLTFG